MKNLTVLLVAILIIFMTCDKPETIPGFVGKPIYLAPVIETSEDTLACTYAWSFSDKPDGSNMDILSFQPNSRSFNVSFVPDIPGEYIVAYNIVGPDGKTKGKQDLLCEVIEDTTSAASTQEDEYALSEEALKAPLPVYEDTKTTVPSVSAYTPPSPPKQRYPIPQSDRGKNIPKISGNFTIQISSWKTYAGAERAVSLLSFLGLDLYIQKAYFNETGETWYRVRTGNFDSRATSKQTMNDLKAKLPHEQLWLDFVREDQ
ncbi:MAG: SPOR domain-containing protein [Candidatus Marinimicrobia bacterium]|nr:SPOR domain-containing protein [bacterium]MCG2714823.1 SPOR domain-containing protein [Candidatus Neomarinimicrobiota bacterium]